MTAELFTQYTKKKSPYFSTFLSPDFRYISSADIYQPNWLTEFVADKVSIRSNLKKGLSVDTYLDFLNWQYSLFSSQSYPDLYEQSTDPLHIHPERFVTYDLIVPLWLCSYGEKKFKVEPGERIQTSKKFGGVVQRAVLTTVQTNNVRYEREIIPDSSNRSALIERTYIPGEYPIITLVLPHHTTYSSSLVRSYSFGDKESSSWERDKLVEIPESVLDQLSTSTENVMNTLNQLGLQLGVAYIQ